MIDIKEIRIQCVGYSIAADWYQGSGDGMLLMLPGYDTTKERQKDLTTALVKQTNNSALVIDYSGTGESPFKFDEITPAQNFLEVITAFDWLINNYPTLKMSVIGSSYGGFLATQLTKYRTFNTLVLRAPALFPPNSFYDNLADINNDDMHKYRADARNFVAHPLLGRAAKFGGDVFVVVHEFDKSCPNPTTSAFIRAFGADSWLAKGFEHRTSINSREELEVYRTRIADWLNSR